MIHEVFLCASPNANHQNWWEVLGWPVKHWSHCLVRIYWSWLGWSNSSLPLPPDLMNSLSALYLTVEFILFLLINDDKNKKKEKNTWEASFTWLVHQISFNKARWGNWNPLTNIHYVNRRWAHGKRYNRLFWRTSSLRIYSADKSFSFPSVS